MLSRSTLHCPSPSRSTAHDRCTSDETPNEVSPTSVHGHLTTPKQSPCDDTEHGWSFERVDVGHGAGAQARSNWPVGGWRTFAGHDLPGSPPPSCETDGSWQELRPLIRLHSGRVFDAASELHDPSVPGSAARVGRLGGTVTWCVDSIALNARWPRCTARSCPSAGTHLVYQTYSMRDEVGRGCLCPSDPSSGVGRATSFTEAEI